MILLYANCVSKRVTLESVSTRSVVLVHIERFRRKSWLTLWPDQCFTGTLRARDSTVCLLDGNANCSRLEAPNALKICSDRENISCQEISAKAI